MGRRSVKNSLRRNPAATTTASAGIIIVALLQTFNVTLTEEQTSALIVAVAALPGFINWLKTQWKWLQGVVKSGEEGQ